MPFIRVQPNRRLNVRSSMQPHYQTAIRLGPGDGRHGGAQFGDSELVSARLGGIIYSTELAGWKIFWILNLSFHFQFSATPACTSLRLNTSIDLINIVF